MWKNIPWKTILGIWICWLIILIGFQTVIKWRVGDLQRPDRVLEWTENETMFSSQMNKPFLLEDFMNNQVCWDSEFYLAIAVDGYNSPRVRTTPVQLAAVSGIQGLIQKFGVSLPETEYSLSYAFFPMYSIFIWLFSWPIRLFGLNEIAAAALAGVIVSALGTLLAMVSLYDLTKSDEGHEGGLRAVWYLLIFPTGFFLAMVYTEALFIGLSFTALAAIRGKNWWIAGLTAGLATLTRPIGGALLIPLVWAWVEQKTWKEFLPWGKSSWLACFKTLMVIMPLLVFIPWRLSIYGTAYTAVEESFFGRFLFDIPHSITSWSTAFQLMLGENMQTRVNYALEFGAIIITLLASIWYLKKRPAEAVYGLVLLMIPLFSGSSAQGIPRYILAVPAVFYLLAKFGKKVVFDRVWTLFSILFFGMEAMLFAFDFWVN